MKSGHKIGTNKWGVYAFYDYDGETDYVGQETLKGFAAELVAT